MTSVGVKLVQQVAPSVAHVTSNIPLENEMILGVCTFELGRFDDATLEHRRCPPLGDIGIPLPIEHGELAGGGNVAERIVPQREGFPDFRNDGGDAATERKREVPDAAHAVGDGDGGQTTTAVERKVPDAGHTIGHAITFNGGGNGDRAGIGRCKLLFVGHFRCLATGVQVVVDAIHYTVIR